MMTASRLAFALNHMVAPGLPPKDFFALCRSLGIARAEIRNDLDGNAIIDGTPAADIGTLAADAGVSILSINALQRFNEWTPARRDEATRLADYARACGSWALVLVPVNDGTGQGEAERRRNLREALTALKPI